jgi:hypothetical protein
MLRSMTLARTLSLQDLARRAVALLLAVSPVAATADVSLAGRIELPGTPGRLDHLAVDLEHGHLFVAALAANAIEVLDVKAGRRITRLEGRREPQGLAFLPPMQRLMVANGEGGNLEAFNTERHVGAVGALPDADNLRLDAGSGRLYVGYGSGLAAVNPSTLQVTERITLPGHPEAFELSQRGPEIYVNVPTIGAIVVVDRRTGKETARWSIAPATRNFPMALDEASHRLFVATRAPSGLQVFDTLSGVRVAQLPLCGDADDLFLDAGRQRLYAVCGDGHLAIVSSRHGDRYQAVQAIATAPGARTGLWVPAMNTLYVAMPASQDTPAAVLVYRID